MKPMNPLSSLQPCLAALAQHCDILPTGGGAAEAMIQPDADERDDELLSGHAEKNSPPSRGGER
ncbi:MAG: hypothetical protein NZT92_05665 [Abditibacteriales bacterium]|nr:hypothetical protein [Abditibacteriales bacterium]MDW8365464.1 hypothetical protein [Abditibacteriales bacterium]